MCESHVSQRAKEGKIRLTFSDAMGSEISLSNSVRPELEIHLGEAQRRVPV